MHINSIYFTLYSTMVLLLLLPNCKGLTLIDVSDEPTKKIGSQSFWSKALDKHINGHYL